MRNKDTAFTSGKNLQDILCQNKPKLLSNNRHTMNLSDWSYNGSCTSKLRCTKHQQGSIKG